MEYIRTATQEFVVGGQLTLQIENGSGNMVVEGQQTDRATVQIVAHIQEDSPEAADSVLDQVLAGISQRDTTLAVAVPRFAGQGPWSIFGRGTRVDYTLTVPRETRCILSSRSGRVEVARVAGPVEIEQRSGRTTVREVGGDVVVGSRSGSTEIEDVGGRLKLGAHSGRVLVRGVRGDATVATHSGSIEAAQIGGIAEITCHSGGIQVEDVGGDLRAVSQSGRISASGIGGEARLDARAGTITLTEARGGARLRAASGSATYRGSVLGDLDIQTASGSVRLEIDPDPPFFLDAESSSGAIHSDLAPRRDAAPPAEGAPRLRVRTASGSIRLSRYAGV